MNKKTNSIGLPKKRIIALSILAALSVLSASTSRAQNANAIGVNLTFGNSYSSDSSTVGSLVPVDPAGVFRITNWNNALGAITGGGGAWQNYPGLVIYTNNLQDSLAANS